MSSERPWARHFQDDWQARAGDPRLPYWLRVSSLAYGSHEDNGHARFKRGEISLILATVDKESGEVAPYRRVGRAIDDAITYGWLEPDSFWGCLIVPAHSIRRGAWTTPKPCPIHIRKAMRQTPNCSLTEQFGVRSSPLGEQFSDRTAHSLSSSEPAPLFLICSPNGTTDQPQADPERPAS